MKFTFRKGYAAAAIGLASATFALAQPAFAEMTVRDFILTTGVANREPVDAVASVQTMDGAGKAVVFARINNPDPRASVSFVWYKGDQERARKSVNVGTSTGWRTWSRSAVDTGSWRVDLVDGNGKVLAQKDFVVAGANEPAPSPQAQDASPQAMQSAPPPAMQPAETPAMQPAETPAMQPAETPAMQPATAPMQEQGSGGASQ